MKPNLKSESTRREVMSDGAAVAAWQLLAFPWPSRRRQGGRLLSVLSTTLANWRRACATARPSRTPLTLDPAAT
jgi:hypothetical protein